MIKMLAISAMIVAGSIVPAAADYYDDQLARAEKSVVNAEKKLAAARYCVANKDECRARDIAKAQRTADNAAKRLAALQE